MRSRRTHRSASAQALRAYEKVDGCNSRAKELAIQSCSRALELLYIDQGTALR